MAGKYVVIEGNDGTGKSTQVELLERFLNQKGIQTFTMHEPAGTAISDEIRTIIKNGELERSAETNLLLFTAARHENWREARKALDAGKWVISARNYLSTEVYQGIGEGLAVDEIHQMTRRFTDETYMTPDYTLVLSILDDAVRSERVQSREDSLEKDTFESRGEDFQTKLNDGYRQLAEKYGFPLIDAGKSIDEVHAQIISVIAL